MAGEVTTALVEGRYLDKDGDEIWLLVSAAMIQDAEDQPLYVISQVQDISERKKSEVALRDSDERLRILFDSAPDAYFLLDHHGTFIDGNQAAEKMTGYHRLELFRNNFFDINLLSAVDMRKMEDRLAKVSENKVVGPDEYILTRKDGTKVPIEMRCFLVTIQDLPVVLSIARDTSERKETESRLADMHQQLLHHSRQAGRAEVATTVLHDVGNVLNSINVSSCLVAEKLRKSHISALPHTVDLLQKHKDDLAGFFANNPKGKQLTAYLGRLSSHLLTEQHEIVEELVLLGKNIEHVKEIIAMQQAYTKISSESERTDLKQLVEDSLRMYIKTLERHNIKIVRDYDPTPAIMLEKHKLMQVLVNLIQNSKFACTESGSVEPELRLRIRTKNDCVSISVIDNGVGIEPENLSCLFNYGFTTREEGNGFGLYSAALAMQELGGSLSAHSDGPGHGAEFTLELPIPSESKLHE
jgi:PAS domain S-box-containing protein